jgi:hypothetical protein
VMLDLETAVDAAWVTTFAGVVKAAGLDTGMLVTTVNGKFTPYAVTSPDGNVWTVTGS